VSTRRTAYTGLLLLLALHGTAAAEPAPGGRSDDASPAAGGQRPGGPARPWYGLLRLGGGYDSNAERNVTGTRQAALLRSDGLLEVHLLPVLRAQLAGNFQQNLRDASISEGDAELTLSYQQELAADLVLILAAQVAARRELAVFSDGLQNVGGRFLRTSWEQHSVASLTREFRLVDLELGLRADLATISGNESYALASAAPFLGLRWLPRPLLALRLRYSHVWRVVDDLFIHDEVAGTLLLSQDHLPLTQHQLTLSLRHQTSSALAMGGRVERTWQDDSSTDFYSGTLTTARITAEYDAARQLTAYGSGHINRRKYGERVPGLNVLTGETSFGGELDVSLWLWADYGMFLRYGFEQVAIDELGDRFTRHTIILGSAARRGSPR
jgi:hypothetical protein